MLVLTWLHMWILTHAVAAFRVRRLITEASERPMALSSSPEVHGKFMIARVCRRL